MCNHSGDEDSEESHAFRSESSCESDDDGHDIYFNPETNKTQKDMLITGIHNYDILQNPIYKEMF